MNADKSRSVILTIVEHSRTVRLTITTLMVVNTRIMTAVTVTAAGIRRRKKAIALMATTTRPQSCFASSAITTNGVVTTTLRIRPWKVVIFPLATRVAW